MKAGRDRVQREEQAEWNQMPLEPNVIMREREGDNLEVKLGRKLREIIAERKHSSACLIFQLKAISFS